MEAIETKTRTCGECKACCDGWMIATIYGHEMGNGVRCHFLRANGCGIYERRPHFCRSFECGWLMANSPFPDHWRPDRIGLIICPDIWQGKRCWVVLRAGGDPSDETLETMRQVTMTSGEPHILEKKNSWLCFGKPEFQRAMLQRGKEALRRLAAR